MQFFFGPYYHAANSVAFAGITRSYIDGQTQRHKIMRVDWRLKGRLLGTSQSDIMTQLGTVMQVYNSGGQSAGMLDNSGNLTPLLLDTNQALGGVHVTSPISHDAIKGAAGNTYLDYTFALQADFAWAYSYDIMSFTETLSFSNNNGGPKYVYREPANGSPIRQQVTERSFFYVTQAGTLTQPGANPNPMPPMFDSVYLKADSNGALTVSYMSPQTTRGRPTEYAVQWRYDFISPDPLEAYPNVRG